MMQEDLENFDLGDIIKDKFGLVYERITLPSARHAAVNLEADIYGYRHTCII